MRNKRKKTPVDPAFTAASPQAAEGQAVGRPGPRARPPLGLPDLVKTLVNQQRGAGNLFMDEMPIACHSREDPNIGKCMLCVCQIDLSKA